MKSVENPYRNIIDSHEKYSVYEYKLAQDFIIPLLIRWGLQLKGRKVLDLGCGGGGTSIALAEIGSKCSGIDRNKNFLAEATKRANNHRVQIRFVQADILDIDELGDRFDLIIMSEFLEHLVSLSNVAAVLQWCEQHLNKNGKMFVSFPPWYNPFAGHQAGWPVIRFIPWFHLLPEKLQLSLAPKHANRYIRFSQELNRLTVRQFETLVNQSSLFINRRELYHLRPEYHWRYGTPIIRFIPLFESFPHVRELLSTGAFYLLGRDGSDQESGSA